VLRYLGRYTHRVAISNHRLVAFDGKQVTFCWRDYARGNRQSEMTVSAEEFIRRFLVLSVASRLRQPLSSTPSSMFATLMTRAVPCWPKAAYDGTTVTYGGPLLVLGRHIKRSVLDAIGLQPVCSAITIRQERRILRMRVRQSPRVLDRAKVPLRACRNLGNHS